jgi:predicted ester cyclase
LKAFPDLHMTIQDIVGENEKIVVAWTISSTHDGEFMGIPATHKKVSADGIANRLDGF